MIPSLWLHQTFIALGLSILGAWTQPGGREEAGLSRWLPFYLVALASGYMGHFLRFPAILSLTVLFIISRYSTNPKLDRNSRILLFGITVLVSLALALHLAPGFRNPVLVDTIKLSADSVPFKQFANFDKASVGLALLLFVCPRTRSMNELGQVLRRATVPAVATAVTVLTLSLMAGVTHVDVKLPAFSLLFLLTNLLFTCVAEEAFFRGLIQTNLAAALSKARLRNFGAIGGSGALFGLMHLGGGAAYAALATIAGFGYAYVYAKTQRIEAAIMTHFLVNVLHFFLLTYPAAV